MMLTVISKSKNCFLLNQTEGRLMVPSDTILKMPIFLAKTKPLKRAF